MAGLKNMHHSIRIIILIGVSVLICSVYASKSWSGAIGMIITIYHNAHRDAVLHVAARLA